MSDGSEGVLCIPESSRLTGTSPSDCLGLYVGHPLGEVSYPSGEKQSVYSTTPIDWDIFLKESSEPVIIISKLNAYVYTDNLDDLGNLSIEYWCYGEVIFHDDKISFHRVKEDENVFFWKGI